MARSAASSSSRRRGSRVARGHTRTETSIASAARRQHRAGWLRRGGRLPPSPARSRCRPAWLRALGRQRAPPVAPAPAPPSATAPARGAWARRRCRCGAAARRPGTRAIVARHCSRRAGSSASQGRTRQAAFGHHRVKDTQKIQVQATESIRHGVCAEQGAIYSPHE